MPSAVAGASAGTLLLLAKLMLMLLVTSIAGYVGWLLAQKIAVVTTWVVEIAEYMASGISWVMSFTMMAKLAEYVGPMLYTFQPIIAMAAPALAPMQGAVPIITSIPGGRLVTASVSVFMAAITVCFKSNTNSAVLP